MKRGKFSCPVRLLFTILLSICFVAHIQKELFKFLEARTTTSTSIQESTTLPMPTMAICAEQVLNTSYPGMSCFTLSHCCKRSKI